MLFSWFNFIKWNAQNIVNSVRGCERNPSIISTLQNWIGSRGLTIEDTIFVPPVPEDVPALLDNLFKYMNEVYIDPIVVNLAIFHSQFETIHPYRDGNGRVGRALIPIQLGILVQDSTRIKKSYKYLRVYDVFVGKEYY